MTTQGSGHRPSAGAQDHDQAERWQEADFVQQWVDRDDGRQDTRGPMVQDTVAALPFAHDAAISVLDIGAGYGILSAEVLRVFSNASVTLQDVSEPMFEHAKQRLAADAARTTYTISDFSQRDWASGLGGPFDAAVSAIAIHNMYDDGLIAGIYKDICGVLKPGGVFINMDYAAQAGGVDAHVAWLKESGFASVEVVAVNDRLSRLIATR